VTVETKFSADLINIDRCTQYIFALVHTVHKGFKYNKKVEKITNKIYKIQHIFKS